MFLQEKMVRPEKQLRKVERMGGKKSFVYNQMSIELLFSSQFLRDYERVATLMDILIKSQSCYLINNQKSDDPMLNIAYSKLQLLCQTSKTSNPISTFKLWHKSDVITHITLRKELINVIVADSWNEMADIGDCKNVIFVREMNELRQIFKMSIFDLSKKCKMERIMRISQRRSKQNGAKQNIKKMALLYDSLKCASQLRVFLGFMRFNTKWYKARIAKCFNLWLIETYEKNIEKTNEKIVKEEHFCKKSKSVLVNCCFKGWKSVVKMQKNGIKQT